MRVGPYSNMTGILIKMENLDTDTHRDTHRESAMWT